MKLKGPDGFNRITSILFNLTIGVIVGACVLVSVQGMPGNAAELAAMLPAWARSTILGFFVGFTMTDLVPAMDWARRLVRALCIESALLAHLVISIVLGSVMGVCILFFCSLINNMLSGGVMSFFWAQLPVVLAGATGAVITFLKPVTMVAAKVSGFNPPSYDQTIDEKPRPVA